MVESGGLLPDQDAIEPIPQLRPFQLLHNFQQNLIAVLVLEDFDDLVTGQPFESVIDALVSPIDGDALEDDITGELPHRIADKLGQNPLSNGRAFIDLKQLLSLIHI